MKRILKPIAFAVLLLSLSLNSCDIGVRNITGSGNVVTQNRNVADFTKIEVESGMDVVIEQGDAKAVIVEADDNLQNHIKTEVSNGTLKISSEFNSFTNATKKITVRTPIIKSIESSGGASVTTNGTINSDNLELDASSGSELTVSIEADNVSCESSSGSNLTVTGKTLTAKTSASSGSVIDADGLMANEVKSESSSGSTTSVHPIVSLVAEASSGSSISYSGSPKTIKREENSGGSVSGK